MTQITLNVSDTQARMLAQFAENQAPGSPDNVCTHKPLHLVQTQDVTYIFDDGECDDPVFKMLNPYDMDGDFENPEDLVRAYFNQHPEDGHPEIISYDDAYFYGLALPSGEERHIYNEKEYFAAYGIQALRLSRVIKWRAVSTHFTLAEAKRYIQYQAHNLRNPRTYTISGGYSNNGDYEPLWDFLFAAGVAVHMQLEAGAPAEAAT